MVATSEEARHERPSLSFLQGFKNFLAPTSKPLEEAYYATTEQVADMAMAMMRNV